MKKNIVFTMMHNIWYKPWTLNFDFLNVFLLFIYYKQSQQREVILASQVVLWSDSGLSP